MTSTASKETNFALVGIRLGASNIAVAYFKVKDAQNCWAFRDIFSSLFRMAEAKRLSMN